MPQLLVIAPFPAEFLHALGAGHMLHDLTRAADPAALLADVGPQVQAIVGNGGSIVDVALLDALPAARIVSINGVGYDGVDLASCRARGIAVTNTPDVLTNDVADIALALALMTSRGLVAANRALHRGDWAAGAGTLTRAVARRRAGIVGLGRIGKAIAQRLAACGMDIAYHGRSQQADLPYAYHADLCELARWCDMLVVACPGGAATRHLINAQVLAALGAQGTLINIARGSVVDERALIAALQAGTIASAGLDVFENEPHVPAELLALPQLVLLPHVGSATRETRGAMGQLVIDNLAAHFAAAPLLTRVV
jgi:hydroxypyruvate reductase